MDDPTNTLDHTVRPRSTEIRCVVCGLEDVLAPASLVFVRDSPQIGPDHVHRRNVLKDNKYPFEPS